MSDFLDKKDSPEEVKNLRKLGWMTQDEFLERYNLALKHYLLEHTYLGRYKDKLHHPEDIMMNISTFNEVAYHVLVAFGTAPVKKEK